MAQFERVVAIAAVLTGFERHEHRASPRISADEAHQMQRATALERLICDGRQSVDKREMDGEWARGACELNVRHMETHAA